MAENKDRTLKLTYVLMMCGFLLTVPTLIYGLITTFYQRSFNEMMIESGFTDKLHLITVISLLLPIAGLVLVLYARLVIEQKSTRYSFYQVKNNQLLYNNLLLVYFITLSVMAIIYLAYS